VDGQCGKLVTVIGHQFITLTVNICVQHGGCEVLRRAGMSAAAETCNSEQHQKLKLIKMQDGGKGNTANVRLIRRKK